jgi:signal transduction histidine kinase
MIIKIKKKHTFTNITLDKSTNIILEIISEINSINFVNEIAKSFLLKISVHFLIDNAAIYLKDFDDNSFYLISYYGNENLKTCYFLNDEGISDIYNLKSYLIFNKIYPNDKNVFDFLRFNEKALISPLIYNETIIGITFFGRENNFNFNDDEINLILACSNELAKTLHNIILIRKNQISQAKLIETHELLKSFETLKNSFIYNITHEFRTPLVTIKGYLDMLKDEDLGNLNSQQKKAINVIFKNSNQLSFMIDNLLLFIQLSDKIKQFNKEKVNFPEFVREIINEYENSPTPIILFTSTNELFLSLNCELLKVAIKQLIDNAIKFNKDNKPIMISIEKKDDNIYFLVIDKGIGMDEETIKNITTLFYQQSRDLARKYGGLGFGLALTNKIFELHNFKLIIESKINEGTKIGFKVHISEN